jgi:peptidase E
MKTKLILHGGFTSTQNELNQSFYKEISKDVPEGGSILLIYFAREEREIPELFEQDKERILEQAGGKKLNIILATKEDFVDKVKEADTLYMRGGDTDKLMGTLQQFPAFKSLIKGKTVAGSSAGAYVISQYSAGHSVTYIRKGLGLAPLRVVCHYQSSDLPPNEKSLSTLKNTAPESELVLLKDYEWVVREVDL